MSFALPKNLAPRAARLLERACFAGGYDQTPMPTIAALDGGCLHLSRDENESGYLMVPWPVEPFGAFIVTTATLREREQPYPLLVELARGKLNQVRTQTAEWQGLGLNTTADYNRELDDATRLFGKSVLESDATEAERLADRVLGMAFALADRLIRIYTQQMFELRTRDERRLETHLSAGLARVPSDALPAEYRLAFNAVRIGRRWCDLEPVESEYEWDDLDAAVEFGRVADVPMAFGPLIDLAPGLLPPWAAGWQGDLPTLAAFMCDYVETVIARYRKSVKRWVVCAGFNHADGLGLSDDDRLRLAARLFETAHQRDPKAELVLSLAQPWGDYLIRDEQTISPFSFADDLLRAGAKISAIDLELRMGTMPRGSWPRDRLDTSRLLDTFSMLAVPLEVTLGAPADASADPLAAAHGEARDADLWTGDPTAASQAEWGAAFAELVLCKPQVRSVAWSHFSDAEPHQIPHGGLVDSKGEARPLLARLGNLRSARLR